MNKLLSGYFILNILFILFNAAMAGGGGVASVSLTQPMTTTSNTMYVTSTNGFLTSDVLVADNELIAYTGKTATSFTGLTRGYNSSQPAAHSAGKIVYTQEMNMLNEVLGFNVASTSSSSGMFTVVAMGFTFFSRTLINLVIWDYPNIFQGQLVYLRILLIAMGSALIIFMAINYLLPAMGLLNKTG